MSHVIIFDFDKTIGTLVVDWDVWRKHVWDLVAELDSRTKLDVSDIKHAVQNELILKYGDNFKKKLNKINEKYEENCVTEFIVNQKVLHFIKNTDCDLYCWSSNSRKTIEKYLAEIGIVHVFKKIVSREDTQLLKPSTEGFKYIYDDTFSNEQYTFIGDSVVDEEAADSLGINFIHVDNIEQLTDKL